MRNEMSELETRVDEIKGQIAAHRARIDEIDAQRKKLAEDAESARNVAEGRKMRIANRERELNELTEELTKQIVELRSTDSRISMLEEMEREYEGFGGAVKAVMREARRGSLRGVHGTVSELLRTGRGHRPRHRNRAGRRHTERRCRHAERRQTRHRVFAETQCGQGDLPAPGRHTRRQAGAHTRRGRGLPRPGCGLGRVRFALQERVREPPGPYPHSRDAYGRHSHIPAQRRTGANRHARRPGHERRRLHDRRQRR